MRMTFSQSLQDSLLQLPKVDLHQRDSHGIHEFHPNFDHETYEHENDLENHYGENGEHKQGHHNPDPIARTNEHDEIVDVRSWPKHPQTAEHYSVDAGLTNDGGLEEDYQHETDHAAEYQTNHQAARQHTDNIPIIPNNGTHKHMDNDDVHTQQYHTDTLKAPINSNGFLNLWSESSKKSMSIENDFKDSPAVKRPYSGDNSFHHTHNDGEPELNSEESHHAAIARKSHHDQLSHSEVEKVAHRPEHYQHSKHKEMHDKRDHADGIWNGEWPESLDFGSDDDDDDDDEDVLVPTDTNEHHQQNNKDYLEDYDHAGDHLPGKSTSYNILSSIEKCSKRLSFFLACVDNSVLAFSS